MCPTHGLCGWLTRTFTNVTVATLYGLFAYEHFLSFRHQPRASLIIIVAVEALIAVLAVIRCPADRTSFSVAAWSTTAGAMMMPLLLRPIADGRDLPSGEVLQVFGAVLVISSALSLNRSFGLLPAHRKIRSSGLYRFVRHPLYCAYLVLHIGYLLNHPTFANLSIIVFTTGLQIVRLLNEERLLSEYPEYRRYTAATRWRLVPFVF